MPDDATPPTNLLEGLTDPQREAASHVDGPLLVLAGPGSGKTRVITRRIAHLVRDIGIAPWNVLAITFTNKAAGEMRERVAGLVSERQARALTVATFHSLCARLLRQYGDRLGLAPGYSIYDTSDQKRAMKQVLDDLEINAKNFPPAAMLGAISKAKNDLLVAKDFAAQAANFYDRTVAKVYTKYEEVLTRNDALDFDDLLLAVTKTSWSPATPTRASTAGAGPTSPTSSTSRATSAAPPSCGSNRTTAARPASSPPPTR